MNTKEAIERVRSRFDKWALDNEDLTALQTLGLTDTDSEDEKIREEIVKHFAEVIDNITSEEEISHESKVLAGKMRKWITWLEKHKEQKHSLSFDVISSWLRDNVSRYINSEFNEFHHCVEYDGTINVERLIADLKVAVDSSTFDIYEQKEQKPVECIEFDNEFKNQVSHLLASVLNKEWDYTKGFVEYTAQQLLGYAKHEIKTAKWSEEDKVMLDNIIWGVHMKSIKPLDEMDDRSKYKKYEDFLKSLPTRFSLQPHWKPSEEQMGALNYAYCELFKREDVGHNILGPLQNLIDTLSKL